MHTFLTYIYHFSEIQFAKKVLRFMPISRLS